MKLSLFQYNPVWENKELNKNNIEALLKSKFTQSDLLIFPELTLSGFSMRTKELAEELSGESFSFFSTVAQRYQTDVIAGLIERYNDKYYNTLIHIDRAGQSVTSYRKIHPFAMAGEDKYFSAGQQPMATNIANFKAGLSICYDLRFPELFRLYAKDMVHLIVVIANWPVARIEHWRTLLKARAIENQCYVAGVNRVGADPSATYNGYSSIIDPSGNILAESQQETIIDAEISSEKVLDVREKFPFMNDIRLV